jgi:hypothetical protein
MPQLSIVSALMPSEVLPAGAGLRLERSVRSRLVAGMSITLLHVLLVLAFLRSGQAPDARHDDQTADYIAFAFIAAPKTPLAVEKPEPPPPTAPRMRPRPALVPAREAAPQPAPVGVVQASPPGTDAQPAPVAQARLDMQSLRAAARQVDSERSPDAGHESGQLRAMDDTGLARAVQRAKTPDCQTKYAGGEKANLILLIPLAIDTITGKGCKW